MRVILILSLIIFGNACAHQMPESQGGESFPYWPPHTGALYDEENSEAYLGRILNKDTSPLKGIYGRDGEESQDSVTMCGVRFQGFLRHRPDESTYFILLAQSVDEKEHVLKWIPMEYRFDHELPQKVKIKRKASKINAPFQYLYAFKMPVLRDKRAFQRFLVYLPWVDECASKPVVGFYKKNQKDKEIFSQYRVNSWIEAGTQFMAPVRQRGWNTVRPYFSGFLRFVHLGWGSHGFSLEGHAALVKGIESSGSVVGFLARASYVYAFWLNDRLILMPELGMRGLLGTDGFNLPAVGGGVNLVWEFPGTRHFKTGQRFIVETGCDLQKHFSGAAIRGHDLSGAWGSCKIGFGLGW